MSLRKNIAASYASQIYVTLIGVVLVPVYIQMMGIEAYGLVGFFTMLQIWFNLLDAGFTPTVARETARFRGGISDATTYRRVVRALETLFLSVAAIAGMALFFLANDIATDWLKATELPVKEVRTAVEMMAGMVAVRWVCGLYRGVISGSERLVWLGAFNSLVATLRFGGVLPALLIMGPTPTVFFGYQLLIVVAELGILIWFAYRQMPRIRPGTGLGISLRPLRPILGFSMTIAFTSSVWVLITQTDKLILSRLLSLDEYGYYSLAVIAATVVMLISGPVSTALMPRLANLESRGEHVAMIQSYRRMTQFVALLAGSMALTIALHAESLLWVWSGDPRLASQAAPVLSLYALGNGILAVAAFPYYLQYAKGDLRLHLIGNAIFVVLLVPAVYWAATNYGAVGAGCVWVAINVLSLVAWLPLVHHKFEPGLNRLWYFEDVLAIFAGMAISGYLSALILPESSDRVMQFWILAAAGCLTYAGGAISSSQCRLLLATFVARRRLWSRGPYAIFTN